MYIWGNLDLAMSVFTSKNQWQKSESKSGQQLVDRCFQGGMVFLLVSRVKRKCSLCIFGEIQTWPCLFLHPKISGRNQNQNQVNNQLIDAFRVVLFFYWSRGSKTPFLVVNFDQSPRMSDICLLILDQFDIPDNYYYYNNSGKLNNSLNI